MAKVYLICGKICSGKTYYARRLADAHNAVILSTDEATFDLIRNEQGEFYNVFAARVNGYLRKKAVQICKAGANVVLDWGFWTREDRQAIRQYLDENGVGSEMHCIDISDALWMRNIAERNERIRQGRGGSDFYVDEGLMAKLLSLYQQPDDDEVDVRYRADDRTREERE